MNDIESKALFSQVRVAHRLLAAYYQRIQGVIKKVAEDSLELRFYYWRPTRFSRPLRRSGNQLRKWSWDLLPGVQTEYVFVHGEKKKQQLGDWILRVHVVTDTGVESEESAKNPLEVKVSPEDGHSVCRFYVVAPRTHLTGDWYGNVWRSLGSVDLASETPYCLNRDKQIYACAFQVPMEELTAEGSAEDLIRKIKVCRDAVLGDVLTESVTNDQTD